MGALPHSKTYGQARQVAFRLSQGAPVLCIVKTKRQRDLMRLFVAEILEEQAVDAANIELMDLRCMEA